MQKVVIADDEPKVSRLIRELIRWDELDLQLVGICPDGQKALSLIQSEKPDIVITDIRMPVLSGLNLIKSAFEENLPIHFIVVSGYRYFEYAHTALKYGVEDYLLKPIDEEELNAALKRICTEENEKKQEKAYLSSMERKFSGSRYILHREWAESLMNPTAQSLLSVSSAEYGLDFQPGVYLALAVKADRQPDVARSPEQEKMLQEKMIQAIEKDFRPLVSELAVVPEKAQKLLVFLNYTEQNQAAVQQQVFLFLTHLKNCANDFSGYTVSLGISSAAKDLEQAGTLLLEAQQVLDQRILEGTGICLRNGGGKSLRRPQEQAAEVIRVKGNNVLKAAETLQPEQLANGIVGCFAEAEGETVPGCTYYALSGQLIETFLSGTGGEKDEWLKTSCDECRERAENCTSVRRLREELTGGLTGVLQQWKARLQEQERRPVQEAIRYIRRNYAEKITLENAAAASGFNANYFSDLFKRETGRNFTDYLVDVRMNAAKELLRDSTKTVYEVADSVGYKDSKFFSQQFTKTVGIKPTEYRKIYS